jgi:predicted O-methyltransferase YrrM
MKIEDVASVVGDTPFMTADQARRMTKLIRRSRAARVLELGFAHGVSTCYIAAALDEMGEGSVTSIDLVGSAQREPRAEDLLEKCGLAGRVELIREPRSFTWRMMRWLDEGRHDAFDLVYLDGGHSWDVTGFAFFLVDRLLAPGGWLVFDDIDWTFETSPFYTAGQLAGMPEDFRSTPQVRKVFELLVLPHPGYERGRIDGSWGVARKRAAASDRPWRRR